jgi:hypothetical protein
VAGVSKRTQEQASRLNNIGYASVKVVPLTGFKAFKEPHFLLDESTRDMHAAISVMN